MWKQALTSCQLTPGMKTIIKDILGPEVKGISDVVIINPGECLVFTGQRSKGHGFTQAEAVAYAREIHDSPWTLDWTPGADAVCPQVLEGCES